MDWTWDGDRGQWFHPDPVPALGRLIACHACRAVVQPGDGTSWGRQYAVDLQRESFARIGLLGERHRITPHLQHGALLGILGDLDQILDSTAYPDQITPTAWARNRHWFENALRPNIDRTAGDPTAWRPSDADVFIGQRRGKEVLAIRTGADELAVRSWHANGQMVETYGTWIAGFHGKREVRDEQGTLRTQDAWQRGLRHGESQTWDVAGRLVTRTTWALGRLHGPTELVHGDGAIERGDVAGGFRCGRWTLTTPEGRLLEKGPYVAGMRDGDWLIDGRHIRYAAGRIQEQQMTLWDGV